MIHRPGLAIGLAADADRLLGCDLRSLVAADFQPWADLVDAVSLQGHLSVNLPPMRPHVDAWAGPGQVSLLVVYRYGDFTGAETCWADGQVDMQHGDALFVPHDLVHWTNPTHAPDPYRRVLLGVLLEEK